LKISLKDRRNLINAPKRVAYSLRPFLPRDSMLSPGVSLSVRPSVCHVGALYPDGWRYRHLLSRPGSPIILVFLPRAPLPIFKWNPFKIHGRVGKFCECWMKLLFNTEWYEIGPWLLRNHKWRIDPCRFWWPWLAPNPGFKATV